MRAKAFWLILVALGLGTKRHWHILFAIIMGIIAGIYLPVPEYAPPSQWPFIHQFFDIVGELFIRLISMIVVPLVVSSLIVGVSSLGDSRQLGRMGGKVLLYFLFLMTLSAIMGGALGWFLEPGAQIDTGMLRTGDAALLESQIGAAPTDLKTLFFNMIPGNPFESLAKADLVPVIIFTLLFGAAVASIGEAGRPIVSFFEGLFSATMKLTDWVMILAVPGVFALAFITVAQSGLVIFEQLWAYALIVVIGLLLQVFLVFPILLQVLGRINFLHLYRAISEAIMVAFGTASSSATLPITIACCERRGGISNRIASFVLPTGATINKTGTTLFQVVAVLFLLQAYQIPINEYQLGLIIFFSIIASIGAAGVPSGGLIVIAIVLNSLGKFDLSLMAGGMALLWAIDRILDMCRTVVNVISSCTVAALVAASEGELNRDVLNNRDVWTEVV